jgi:uncharacterized protein (DUF1919 family)
MTFIGIIGFEAVFFSNISIFQENYVLENVKTLYNSSSEGQKTDILLSLKQIQSVTKEAQMVLEKRKKRMNIKSINIKKDIVEN